MQNNGKIIDAVGLAPSRPTGRPENGNGAPAPNRVAEAAVRVLGTMLVLYRHYVPNADYYKNNHTPAE